MESRKRHRNRNLLLQITTSLRLPFPTLDYFDPTCVCVCVSACVCTYIRFNFCTYDPWQSLATSAARERVRNPEIYHFCCHFPRRLLAADHATGGIYVKMNRGSTISLSKSAGCSRGIYTPSINPQLMLLSYQMRKKRA